MFLSFALRSFALKNIPTDHTPPFPTVTSSRASRATPRAPKVAAYGTNGQVREGGNKKQNYAKGKLRNEREQAPPNGVIPSQKTKPTVVIKHTVIFTRGSPTNLTFTFSTTANTTATARDLLGSAPSASSSATGRKRRDAPCRPCQLRHERRAQVPVEHFRLKLSEPHHSGHQGPGQTFPTEALQTPSLRSSR